MIFRCALTNEQLLAIPKSDIEQAMYELLRAHQLGNHLLIITRGGVQCFLEHFDFNLVQKALLKGIGEKFSQYGSLHNESKIYCELSPINSVTKIGTTLQIPFSSITSILVGGPTNLLVEDLSSDGFLLQYTFKQVRDIFNIPQIKIHVVHGGGSTINKVFLDLATKGALTVCVADTDKDSSVAPISSEKKKLLATAAEFLTASCSLLPCREIENTIFPEVIEILPSSRSTQCLAYAKEIVSAEGTMDFWLFFDLKRGLSSNWLSNSDTETRDLIRAKLAHCSLDPNDFTLDGFGENIVSQISVNNRALSIHRDLLRSRLWLHCFETFLHGVLWWFASSGGVRA